MRYYTQSQPILKPLTVNRVFLVVKLIAYTPWCNDNTHSLVQQHTLLGATTHTPWYDNTHSLVQRHTLLGMTTHTPWCNDNTLLGATTHTLLGATKHTSTYKCTAISLLTIRYY